MLTVRPLLLNRIRLGVLLAVGALGLISAACGSGDGGEIDWSAEGLAKLNQNAAVQAHVINSQVAVGPTRLGFGLITAQGGLVHNGQGTVRLFRLDGSKGEQQVELPLRAVALREQTDHKHPDGSNHVHDDPLATMYIAELDLSAGEWWGAELNVEAEGQRYERMRTRFFVAEKSTFPAIGAAAPRTKQPVLRDVKDIAEIDSAKPPDPALHEITVDEGIASGKPTLVAFASPAFCQTRFCGPVVQQVVAPLAQEFGSRANFVHIEPYKLAEARQGKLVPIPQLEEWGLTSEPYLFLLDGSGKVAARFEGVTERDEVAAALNKLLPR